MKFTLACSAYICHFTTLSLSLFNLHTYDVNFVQKLPLSTTMIFWDSIELNYLIFRAFVEIVTKFSTSKFYSWLLFVIEVIRNDV